MRVADLAQGRPSSLNSIVIYSCMCVRLLLRVFSSNYVHLLMSVYMYVCMNFVRYCVPALLSFAVVFQWFLFFTSSPLHRRTPRWILGLLAYFCDFFVFVFCFAKCVLVIGLCVHSTPRLLHVLRRHCHCRSATGRLQFVVLWVVVVIVCMCVLHMHFYGIATSFGMPSPPELFVRWRFFELFRLSGVYYCFCASMYIHIYILSLYIIYVYIATAANFCRQLDSCANCRRNKTQCVAANNKYNTTQTQHIVGRARGRTCGEGYIYIHM